MRHPTIATLAVATLLLAAPFAGAAVSLPEWVGLLFVSGSSHVRITGFDVVNTGPRWRSF